jgi:hypothetical protein
MLRSIYMRTASSRLFFLRIPAYFVVKAHRGRVDPGLWVNLTPYGRLAGRSSIGKGVAPLGVECPLDRHVHRDRWRCPLSERLAVLDESDPMLAESRPAERARLRARPAGLGRVSSRPVMNLIDAYGNEPSRPVYDASQISLPYYET